MRDLALLIVAEVLRERMWAEGRRVVSLEAVWRLAEDELFHATECILCEEWRQT